MQKSPLVSVVLITYNHEKFIRESILSIVEQTYSNLDIVIVNDGSVDGTESEINTIQDSRINYIFQENQGPSAATNAGIRASKGEYIALLSGDDVSYPYRIEDQLNRSINANQKVLMFSQCSFIDESSELIEGKRHFAANSFDYTERSNEEVLNKFFHDGNYICAPSLFVKKDFFYECGFFNESYLQLQDYDLWLRAAIKGYNFEIIQKPLIKYRVLLCGGNLSEPKPDTYVRLSNETLQILENFIEIDNFERFESIFPEIKSKPFFDTGKNLEDKSACLFFIAQLALEKKVNVYKQFGLSLLYKVYELVRKSGSNILNNRLIIDEAGKNDLINLHYYEVTPILFLDLDGKGFQDSMTIRFPAFDLFHKEFEVCADLAKYESVVKMRFDPYENFFGMVEIILFECTFKNGVTEAFEPEKLIDNSVYRRGRKQLFDTFDPNYICVPKRSDIQSVRIRFSVFRQNDSDISQLFAVNRKTIDLLEQEKKTYLLTTNELPFRIAKRVASNKIIVTIFRLVRPILRLLKRGYKKLFRRKAREQKYCYVNPLAKRNEYKRLKNEIAGFQNKPLISVVIPVYNVSPKWLSMAIVSVQRQIYDNWEICIADDCSTNQKTIHYLRSIKDKKNIKIVFSEVNGNISDASNKAAALASGEYIALLDNDDELTPNALYEAVKAINLYNCDFVYSDEDVKLVNGKFNKPHHKPDYAPDQLLSQNYICHLAVFKKSIFEDIGGFRLGYEGAQDHDLFLRLVEKTDRIYHIPKVLYHWKAIPGSTASKYNSKNYAWEAQRRAVQDAMNRRGIEGESVLGKYPGTCRTVRRIKGSPLVSVIIPFNDHPELLQMCLDSIMDKSTYRNFELLCISNNSIQPETFEMMRLFRQRYSNIRFVEYNVPFNFSRINNYGVTLSASEHLVFLNNDIEIITSEWIEAMLEHSQRPEVGAVGAKLYYPNDRIQHAGVIVGIGGSAGHSHKGFKKNHPGYFYKPHIIQNVSAVTAACLMVKRETFQKAGGFDENNLPIAFNDIDFCLRLREMGYLNVFTPYCEAYHHESLSRGYEDTPEKKARFEKEREYLRKRHTEIIMQGDPYYNVNLTLDSENFRLR